MCDGNYISEEKMSGFLKYLSLERTLVFPVDTGKVVEFLEVGALGFPSGDGVLADDVVSYKSLKEYYFPQTELMFTFEGDDVVPNADTSGYVIFGARPCDLEALRVMSVVYSSGKYADPFFQRHFEANLLIGVACKDLKAECFCREMGVDKAFSDFCDIMLVDGGGGYAVVHLSEKGRAELDRFFGVNGRWAMDNGQWTMDNYQPLTVNFQLSKDDTYYFDIIDWEKVTETCKGCGICTYVCPTCYCFDFKDVSEKGQAKRYKCWDSCMYPKFTLHASGHNPRSKRYERYRQRVLHKYKYVPNNFDGAVACTGCGRCIRSCPVGVNIKAILEQIANDK